MKQTTPLSAHREKDFLWNHYPKIKEQLIYWKKNKADQLYNGTIQSISLRYLSHFFLLENSRKSREETIFLMDLIFDLELVDLDVLCDAYLKIKKELDQNTGEKYHQYSWSICK